MNEIEAISAIGKFVIIQPKEDIYGHSITNKIKIGTNR